MSDTSASPGTLLGSFATTGPTMVAVTTGGITFDLLFSAAASASAAFMSGIEQAATILANLITDKITVNLNVDLSGTGGGAAAGPDFVYSETYTTVRNALISHETAGDTTFNSLPVGPSVQGQSTIDLTNAQEKALGFAPANDTGTDDGSATFATDISASALVGVALHELTHALGRIPSGPAPDIFDMFRFTAPGVRLFDGGVPASAASYFSLDGGITKLADFGVRSDPSDFLNTGVQGRNDPFNEYYTGTTSQVLSSVDLKIIDALGFHLAPPAGTTQPDLNISGLQIAPTSAAYTLHNTGTASAGASTVGLYLSTTSSVTNAGTLLGSFAAPSLAAGASSVETINFVVPTTLAPGTYYAALIADSQGLVAESNEGNNVSAVTTVVVGDALANAISGTGAFLYGMDGNDTLTSLGGNNFMFGGAGNDTFISGLGHNTIDGGIGINTVSYASTATAVVATLNGATVSNVTVGGVVTDSIVNIQNITGGSGNDVLTGDANSNYLIGGTGDDTLNGGGGNDVLIGGAGHDTIDGGAGTDTVYYSDKAASVVLTLNGSVAATVSVGGVAEDTVVNVENVVGGSGADILTGDANANVLDGGAGSDILDGGLGNDSLHGGTGADFFRFDTALGSTNVDTVQDFSLVDDIIQLGGSIFTGLANGALTGAEFTVGTAATAATAQIIYDQVHGDIYFDADGTGAGAAVKFAHVTPGLALTNLDFTVFGAPVSGPDFAPSALVATAASLTFTLCNIGTADAGASVSGLYLSTNSMPTTADTLLGSYAAPALAAGLQMDESFALTFPANLAAGTYYLGVITDSTSLVAESNESNNELIATVILGDTVANTLSGANALFYGLDGNDTIKSTGGNNFMFGGAGNDTFISGLGHNTIDGGIGINTVSYASTATAVVATLNGATVSNVTVGGVVTDSIVNIQNITGGSGNDVLTGDANSNYLIGGTGDDTLNGGGGNDVLIGGAGHDTIDGGAGTDTVYYSDKAASVVLTLNGSVAATVSVGGVAEDTVVNVENVVGGSGADILTGDANANVLDGGAGSDILDGGLGNDSLHGGTGADFFRFDTALGSTNVDTVQDFSLVDDIIQLGGSIFTGLANGALTGAEFTVGTAATAATAQIIYDQVHGDIYFDADGTGAGAAVKFAHVTPGLALTNLDFIVI